MTRSAHWPSPTPERTPHARPRLRHPGPRPVVLLVDEIDRADDEFEAFLLEMLAESSLGSVLKYREDLDLARGRGVAWVAGGS